MLRKIVHIDEDRCNGCGVCIPNCVEGALKIIDGKAKLVSDKYCDGLGACLGHCPMDAISVIERESDEFDEEAVVEMLAKEGKTLASHRHTEHKPIHNHGGGCPGSRMMMFNEDSVSSESTVNVKSQLRQWPVQLNLVPVSAPYYENADLLITADCVPFAYANYHQDLLKGKAVAIGCPKLDDTEYYVEKLTEIFRENNIKSITVARMEVPCCGGIVRAVELALQMSGKDIPLNKIVISIRGERM